MSRFGLIVLGEESGSAATLLSLFIYIYLGTGGYLITFLNVLPVASPAAKTTSYPTNRTSEKPWDGDVVVAGLCWMRPRGWSGLRGG